MRTQHKVGHDMATSKKRIFLVEDHPIVRAGVAELIGLEPDLALSGEAGTVTDAYEQVVAGRPDLVLVDIVLKDSSGIDLIRRLRAWDRGTRVLVLSMHDDLLYIERALQAGAMGYISKEQAAQHIVAGIREVLAGRVYLGADAAQALLQRTVCGRQPPRRSGPAALSGRELEVLDLIGRGQGTQAIAAALHLSPKTVGTHRERIRAKLHLRDSAALARFAVEWRIGGRTGRTARRGV
jgi:DNA-binding NarL/FixJ family response regulator